MNKLIVILGPTSTGKTDLALRLAEKFGGELISCDSRQVYIGLDIGTGKLPTDLGSKMNDLRIKKGIGFWEMNGIKIWMYDVISFRKQYTVADYVKDAKKVIKDIQKRKKLPIVVGGTGLYLKALLFGLPNLSIPLDHKLRKRLEKLSTTKLQEKLKNLSLKRWQSLNNSDNQNPRRLLRAIELEIQKPDKTLKRNEGLLQELDILKIGLTSTKDVLYKRSDQRVIRRIHQGMIKEAESLKQRGLSLKRMRQLGLEYGVLADYLDGRIKEIRGDQGLIKIMQYKIHDYIRRQLTWFKKEEDVNWFDIFKRNFLSELEKIVLTWYDSAKN